MDDHSWMYRDSPEGLRKIDYCNEVQSFINYALSNPKNIGGYGIRCPCKRCENKKISQSRCCNDTSFTKKRFIKRYLCWFAHRKPYVPCETMIERIIGSTSSSSNVYEVVDNNNNPYKNMVMNAMRMNQGYVSQCLIIDEELNVDVTKVFDILKDSDKPLWASTQITLNYRSLHKYSPSS